MLKFSVTQLESFNHYISGDMTFAEFKDYLTKPFIETEQIKAGKALHDILENFLERIIYVENELPYFKSNDGITFKFEDISKIYDNVPHDPDLTIFELNGQKIYQCRDTEILVKGRIDSLYGFQGYDHKANFSGEPYLIQNAVNRYRNSVQSEFYMEMFQLETFTYMLYCFDNVTDRNLLDIIPIYKNLPEDLHEKNQTLVEQFAELVITNNLTHLFQVKSYARQSH